LKIVNADKMFTLISVNKKANSENIVQLKLDGNPYLPREFKSEEYKKYELEIYGIKDQSRFITKMSEFVDSYIDFEELDNKKLDVWSDGYQIGEFTFTKYEEIIQTFEKEDWIDKQKSLIAYFYKKSDEHIKDSVRWRKFIDNLEFFIKKEIENTETKNTFLKKIKGTGDKNNSKYVLANKILNLVEQYKQEERENGS